MEKIIVTFNNKRKIGLAIILLSFVSIGCILFFLADELVNYWVISNPWIIRIVGLACVLCFGLMLSLSFKVLFFRKIALIINDEGIDDHSSAGGEAGRINWEQITDIKKLDTVILIFLDDPQGFIDAKRNFINRQSLRMNCRNYNTPVVIPMFTLNSYIDTLEKQIKERWEYSKLKKAPLN